MRIGVLSDTHNHLSNVRRIVELFAEAGVERVIHTGDITQAKTLRELARLERPIHGVWGNNDLERESLLACCREFDLHFVEGPLRLEWAGCRIAVVHDPLDLDAALLGACDLALHGHDHRQRIERLHGALVVNPGECAGHLRGHNRVAVIDLGTLATTLLAF